MTCALCARFTRAEQLPPGWKSYGSLVFCRDCRRQRFRLRSLTMTVAEPIGAQWQEFRIAVEERWRRTIPLLLTDQEWGFTTIEGRHILQVLIQHQWWALRLHDAKWSRGRREAYEKIAAGEATAGEVRLYPKPNYEESAQNRPGRGLRPYEVECKTVVWLPLKCQEQFTTLPARARRLDARIHDYNIGEIDLSVLRTAIRANRISFPSQVPAFPSCGQADLQQKFVQLYFLMGWSCARIAARYGLARHQVRGLLHVWKSRAANTGYLQHIPSADTILRMETLASSLHHEYVHEYVNEHPGQTESLSIALLAL
jgi:hypothetical protein